MNVELSEDLTKNSLNCKFSDNLTFGTFFIDKSDKRVHSLHKREIRECHSFFHKERCRSGTPFFAKEREGEWHSKKTGALNTLLTKSEYHLL